MKKQVFIVALTVLALPAVLFAPGIGRGALTPVNPNVPAAGANKPAAGAAYQSAGALVAAYEGAEADLVAGAVLASGQTGGNAFSAAGQAAQKFVAPTAAVKTSGAKSPALGRLGSK